jgi:alcohol dehydrogenase (cytochrome c)
MSRLILAALSVAAGVTLSAQVDYARLVRAGEFPGDWLTYSGTYSSHRFSPLDEITGSNVRRLKPAWVYQVQRPTGTVQTSPIVAGGTMYITEPGSGVTALDARTGRPLWTFAPTLSSRPVTRVNRGVAILGDSVFVGTVSARLVALDARSGAVRWDVAVESPARGYYVTSAPLAVDGRVIVGVAGGDYGARGFLDAYDARTGDRLWRTYTVPAPGEPGSETWAGESSRRGGGATWLTGSYDPELNLLYWGTGNPAPLWNRDPRAGDNLFTCSVLAIDATSGAIRWHFQFMPGDAHDWDANQIPVLFDATVEGRPRKLLATANRNGFYYLLDRRTGEFLRATPFVKQTWADGIDGKGRPIFGPRSQPTPEGTLIYPGVGTAANWWSPSFSPLTGLFYQPTGESGTTYFKGQAVYSPGVAFTGGSVRHIDVEERWGAIRALEATTGALKWEFRLAQPPVGGLLSTAGGLVFGGTPEGHVFALDAASGAPLWHFQVGSEVRANPIAFAAGGRQHVAVAAGNAMFAFALP